MSIRKEMADIKKILSEAGMYGDTSVLSGASMAQDAMEEQPHENDIMGYPVLSGVHNDYENIEERDFNEFELKLAKRFIELIGDASRAKKLLSKCDECMDCLGLIDDDEQEDIETIEKVSDYMPSQYDLPTKPSADLSALYNPSANVGPFMP